MKMMELDVRGKAENAEDASGIGRFVKKSCAEVKGSRSKNDMREISSYSSSNSTARNASSRSKSMDASNNMRSRLPKRDLNDVEINNCDKSSGQDTPVMCDKSVQVTLSFNISSHFATLDSINIVTLSGCI